MFIGSWIPLGLAAGVETWLQRPEQKESGKDRTDFIIEASLSLLADAGIEVTIPAEYKGGRPRKTLPAAAFDMVRETGAVNSASGEAGAGKPLVQKAVSSYLGRRSGSKVPPSGKVHPKAKAAHPPATPPASS